MDFLQAAIDGRKFRLPGGNSPLRPIALRYRRWVLPVAAIGVVASLAESVGIGLIVPLVALLLVRPAMSGLPTPLREIGETIALVSDRPVIAILVAILLLVIVKVVLQAANAALIAAVEGRAAQAIRDALSQHILALDYANLTAIDHSRLVNIIATDSWQAADAVRWFFGLLSAGIALAVLGMFLLWLEWRLALLVLAAIVPTIFVLGRLRHRVRRMSDAVVDANRSLAARMVAIIEGMRTIRIFGQQGREQARFAAASHDVQATMFTLQKSVSISGPALELLLSVVMVAILLAAWQLGVSVPVGTAFLVLLVRAQPYARTVNDARIGIASVRGSIAEVEWLLALPVAADRDRGSETIDGIAGDISFENVSYAWPAPAVGTLPGPASPLPPRQPALALSGASFTLRQGIATALLGRSGSGKSTVVNLLCRLCDPLSGKIMIGDVPLARLEPKAWRRHVAIAGQDTRLVDGTIADNIAYARPDASAADIEEAGRIGGVEAFLDAAGMGYDTPLLQGGIGLSGGQRQRIAIARAVLARPQLLILDEASNAVDAMTEQDLMALLSRHGFFRAALVISHRKSTLAICEDGIVLEDGRVIAAGRLADLRYYREMSGET